MTIEQNAVDAAHQSVEDAKQDGSYIDLDATSNICTIRADKMVDDNEEGFGGYIEGEGLN